IELEGALEFGQGFSVALDIEHQVVRLVQLGNGKGQLQTPPVFTAVDTATLFFDQATVAIEHTGHLFALVRMNQENDFIMSHCRLLVDSQARRQNDPGLQSPRSDCCTAAVEQGHARSASKPGIVYRCPGLEQDQVLLNHPWRRLTAGVADLYCWPVAPSL